MEKAPLRFPSPPTIFKFEGNLATHSHLGLGSWVTAILFCVWFKAWLFYRQSHFNNPIHLQLLHKCVSHDHSNLVTESWELLFWIKTGVDKRNASVWKKTPHSVHNSAFALALFAFSFSADFSVFQLPLHSVSASQVAATLGSTWAGFGRCSVRSKPSAWIWVFFAFFFHPFFLLSTFLKQYLVLQIIPWQLLHCLDHHQ